MIYITEICNIYEDKNKMIYYQRRGVVICFKYFLHGIVYSFFSSDNGPTHAHSVLYHLPISKKLIDCPSILQMLPSKILHFEAYLIENILQSKTLFFFAQILDNKDGFWFVIFDQPKKGVRKDQFEELKQLCSEEL